MNRWPNRRLIWLLESPTEIASWMLGLMMMEVELEMMMIGKR